MLDDGLIEEVPAPAGEESGDERRRYYAITRFGREVASAEVRRMEGVVRAAAGRLGGPSEDGVKQGAAGNDGRESRLLRALVRLFPRTFRERFGK
jgi:hypothetical protein